MEVSTARHEITLRLTTGLIGLAATAIALGQDFSPFLGTIIPPILSCFQDPESRLRYHACESLYNMWVERKFVL